MEIIGWLYQFYVSEKKDEVFAGGLKKNKKNRQGEHTSCYPAFYTKVDCAIYGGELRWPLMARIASGV